MLRTIRQNLRNAAPFLIATAISLLLFAPTWWRLFEQWLRWDQILAHGLPTFLVFLGLLLVHPPRGRQGTGDKQRPHRQWTLLGGLALIAVTLSWTVFELVNIDMLSALALPATIAGITWALFGFSLAWQLVPHLFILTLSMPFWGDLVPGLVDLASWVVGDFVGRLGMTALIEGESITLPWGRMVIEDGCSGIRYFAISILLASIISLLNDYRLRGWIATLAVAVTLGLIINWIRITLLVVIGYQSQMQSSLMEDHELFGWIIFAVIALPALYLAPVKRRAPQTQPMTDTPVNRKAWISIGMAALVGPLFLFISTGNIQSQPGWALSNAEPATAQSRHVPLALNLPDHLETTHYRLGRNTVWVSLHQYQRPTSQEKLVPYLGQTINRTTWQRRNDLTTPSDRAPAEVLRNIHNNRQIVHLQWYQVGPYTTSDYTMAKLLQIPAALQRDNRFALISVQAQCQTSVCDSAIDEVTRTANTSTFIPTEQQPH